MPVPANISALSTTAGSNSPPGSEAVTTVDDYLRAHAAFIAQLRDQPSAFGLTLIDDASADAALTTLGGTTTGKALFTTASASAARTTLDVYTKAETWLPGDVKFQAHATVPSGWLACDGSAVSRATYSALFAAVGTTWGAGDGSTTFNLPDTENRALVGSGGLYAVGATGGSKDAVVVSHTHSVTDTGHAHGLFEAASGTPGGLPEAPYNGTGQGAANDFTAGATTGITISSSGVSGTDANMMPYAAMLAIIKY
jgi:microcystin-dependent protein